MVPMFGRKIGQMGWESSTIRQESTVCYSKTPIPSVRLEPDIRNHIARLHRRPNPRHNQDARILLRKILLRTYNKI